MRRTYVNIRRLRQIMAILARHGFSHFLDKMTLSERLPWVGRLTGNTREQDIAGPDMPERLALAFDELGPVFIKLGQLLAGRPDLVSPRFLAAFGRLRDRVPPLAAEEIVPVIEKSLHRPLREAFPVFNPAARAAGSIGQAHEAELPDGSRVIVKIRRPGIARMIEDDLSLLEALADLAERRLPELAAVRPKMLVAELHRALGDELDFVGEAARASRFAETMAEGGGVVVPDIYWEYVAPDILVMELEEGESLTEISGLPSGERSRLAGIIADCFARQYFETGLFHADPHAGNFLRRTDGVLAIIDFGLTGRLSSDMRLNLCRMLVAMRAGDTGELAGLLAGIGEFSGGEGFQDFSFDIAHFMERSYGIPARHLDLGALAQEALTIARKNGLCLPRDFVLLVRSLVLVAGLVRELDPEFRLDGTVASATRRLRTEIFTPAAAAERGFRSVLRFASFLRKLPDDFRELTEKAKAGRLTFVFRHDNLQASVERTGRSMDRLTLGIIAAAIIIGSSIVISAGQSGAAAGISIPVFGGVSLSLALASLGFLLALLLAFHVAWGIFRDRK